MDIPAHLEEKEILKINGIPESSVVKSGDKYKFLYNTILRDLRNIKEETIIDKKDKNEQTFYTKSIMTFKKQG